MKRLLGVLSALSLTVSAPSLVVACGTNTRITNPKLNQELAKQLLVSISGNKELANIDFGSMFTDAEIESVIVNMVNELLSLQYSFDSTNSIYDQLGFKDKYTSNNNDGIEIAFKNKYNLESRTIAENKLFEDYTKSFDSTLLDYWSVDNNYNLNIQREVVVNDSNGVPITVSSANKYIYLNSDAEANSAWRFTNEMGSPEGSSNDDNLPTIEQLTQEFKNNTNSPFYVKDEEGVVKNISSKTALYLRFQDYFESKLMEDINENLLTNAYLKSTMFNVKQFTNDQGELEKAPFINPSSAMFSRTQNLNETSINEYWKTNVKMVWTMRFDVTDKSNITNINNVINNSPIINSASGALDQSKNLSDIYDLFSSVSETIRPIEDQKSGYDSYFGLSGYQGLTLYNGENSIGESPISGKSYESAVKNWNNTAGVLKQNSETFLFNDSENGNYADLVLILPIYMIELLGGSTESDHYSIKGKEVSSNSFAEKQEESKIKFSSTSNDLNQYKNRWNNNNNKKLHSKDVAALATDDVKQEALLNQIMYALSKDSSSSDLAKTIIYTKYLDADQVYYAGLWDTIGTYIKSEDDKDD
ncbi:hypothetical protein [Spiroplasma monobiae]|uniref:Lipoprotein n=1 Tax=Spiroplasma monobiae MQ-1 TaxID=1336748 RepID=A0A2K9LV08_SPISQ|nr:hypothetical protein [Spiroplasma monobiae]AUM62877.1 hypothetical protein SMONO_v1c06280 [Spiroplasma monobiae MQ-1]